ncbi:MAG: type II toxin-antitoxin system HicB family antitoxin [Dehalococcoidia bacterium]|nr:type II toxin-antitoxin system HicB family antitoxin [Dehalococcoidia bacterium]
MRTKATSSKTIVSKVKLPILFSQGEDGYIVAECPSLPGCVSQGKTLEEARANIREAVELCLEGMKEEGWSPKQVQVEFLEVSA